MLRWFTENKVASNLLMIAIILGGLLSLPLLDPNQDTPLVVGLFVEAEITGRTVQNVFRLPRSALRNQNEMLIIDDSNRLRLRSVAVLQTDFDSVYIAEGVQAGERICTSPVETFIDGLLVEAVDETLPADQLATTE